MLEHSSGADELAILESLLWKDQPSRLMLTDLHGFSKSKATTRVAGLIGREGTTEQRELPSNVRLRRPAVPAVQRRLRTGGQR